MTITKARKRFEELKGKILKDGAVDYTESEILLDFIAPYVKAHNRKFTEFDRIVRSSRSDGKISPAESETLVKAIDDMSDFLQVESNIEKFVTVAVGALLLMLVLSRFF